MEQIYTGPGKITVELTVPTPKAKPGWRTALWFVIKGLLILAALTMFNYVSGVLLPF